MAINLEGIRKAAGRRIYERTMQRHMGGIKWFNLKPEIRDGFEKYAGETLAVLFEQQTDDLIKFFTGMEWQGQAVNMMEDAIDIILNIAHGQIKSFDQMHKDNPVWKTMTTDAKARTIAIQALGGFTKGVNDEN